MAFFIKVNINYISHTSDSLHFYNYNNIQYIYNNAVESIILNLLWYY